MKIIESSKLIAKYLGWVYVPFNDLQGFKKPGWWEVKKPIGKQELSVTTTTYENGKDNIVSQSIVNMDPSPLKYSRKSGWDKVGTDYVKFICRKHEQLRFYNSFDSLIPVIEKLESEDLSEFHYEWEDFGGSHNNFMGIEFCRLSAVSMVSINLELDPAITIGVGREQGIIKDTFNAVVEAIKYVNNLKDEQNRDK